MAKSRRQPFKSNLPRALMIASPDLATANSGQAFSLDELKRVVEEHPDEYGITPYNVLYLKVNPDVKFDRCELVITWWDYGCLCQMPCNRDHIQQALELTNKQTTTHLAMMRDSGLCTRVAGMYNLTRKGYEAYKLFAFRHQKGPWAHPDSPLPDLAVDNPEEVLNQPLPEDAVDTSGLHPFKNQPLKDDSHPEELN